MASSDDSLKRSKLSSREPRPYLSLSIFSILDLKKFHAFFTAIEKAIPLTAGRKNKFKFDEDVL